MKTLANYQIVFSFLYPIYRKKNKVYIVCNRNTTEKLSNSILSSVVSLTPKINLSYQIERLKNYLTFKKYRATKKHLKSKVFEKKTNAI